MSDSLQPHGLQHARPLCPSPTRRAYSNSCPLGRWCHPVGSHVRHYWQNRGMALNPLPLFRRHGPGMKELGFVILTCFFLSSAELTEENIKVLIVFERSMRRHKAFCSCAQRVIPKVDQCFRVSMEATAWDHGRDCYLKPICEESVYGKGVCWI